MSITVAGHVLISSARVTTSSEAAQDYLRVQSSPNVSYCASFLGYSFSSTGVKVRSQYDSDAEMYRPCMNRALQL